MKSQKLSLEILKIKIYLYIHDTDHITSPLNITNMVEEGPPECLSTYCIKSAMVKISIRPFDILQSPLVSRLLPFPCSPVLFRSLTRDLTLVGGGAGVTGADMSHIPQISWISPGNNFYVFTSVLSPGTLLALNRGKLPGSLVCLPT